MEVVFGFYWTVLLNVVLTVRCGTGFILEGSKRSFVRFPKWHQEFENVLSFEFKTRKANGLLLYMDDGGNTNFYEIRLFSGRLHLQFRLGSRTEKATPNVLMVLGKDLNDNQWHKVVLYQFWEKLKFEVDSMVESRTLAEQKDYFFGSFATNSDVFVGGIAPMIPEEQLSFAPAKHVEHFQGAIRNVVYRTFPHGVTAPHIRDSGGIQDTDDDYCRPGFCRNNGECYNTDAGPMCDCQQPYFEGLYCEKLKEPKEAMFSGTEFLSFDFRSNENGFLSREEEVMLQFKTKRQNGLLFFAGDRQDYLHIGLRDGFVIVKSNLMSKEESLKSEPPMKASPNFRVNDNAWHDLVVHRKLSQLTVVIDGTHSDVYHASGIFGYLKSSVAYVGGKPHSVILPQNLEAGEFVGCLREAVYRADGRVLDFLEEAWRNNSIVINSGPVGFKCQEPKIASAVTLKTSDAFLRVPGWNVAEDESKLSLKIRTNEPNGLLLYNHGTSSFKSTPMFALELLDGQLYVIINFGTKTTKIKASNNRLNDKAWHSITIERSGAVGLISVDGESARFTLQLGDNSSALNLESTMFIGGLPWEKYWNVNYKVWSGSLHIGFVGCVQEFQLNAKIIDLSAFVDEQHSDMIENGCTENAVKCSNSWCRNSGSCIEGWNRLVCYCDSSLHIGPQCDIEPEIYMFNGSQLMTVSLARMPKTEAEDIGLKFSTYQRDPIVNLFGLASTTRAMDGLEVYLSSGQLEIFLYSRQGTKNYRLPQLVNDGRWHSLTVVRRSNTLKLTLDNEIDVTVELPFAPPVFSFDKFWAGKQNRSTAPEALSFAKGFRGSMAEFLFNGRNLFRLAAVSFGAWTDAKNGGDDDEVKALNSLAATPPTNSAAVSFNSRHAFVVLPPLSFLPGSAFEIVFHFRTLDDSALFFYTGSAEGQEFVALELIHGALKFSYNSRGQTAPQSIRTNTPTMLNDLKWHSINLRQSSSGHQTMMVDGRTILQNQAKIQSLLAKERPDPLLLLVGAAELQTSHAVVFPAVISSKHGFRGCFASLRINGAAIDLLNDAVARSDVDPGCKGSAQECSTTTCANGGTCLQNWDSVSCDCELTTFSGPTCSEQSTSYRFGDQPGLITYQFDNGNHPSTTRDSLAIGLITDIADAIVVRIDSASSGDFLMIEILNGYANAVYNLGDEDYVVGNGNTAVNDNKKHVLKFVRSGKNASFEVDDTGAQFSYPIGRKLEVFNYQHTVQIGGRVTQSFLDKRRRSVDGNIERPFIGILDGISFNNLRPLDVAAKNDKRITMHGDIHLLNAPIDHQRQVPSSNGQNIAKDLLRERMMKSAGQSIRTTTDELIVSEEGSGCLSDQADEEDCKILEQQSTTDLITPVLPRRYTTLLPSTTRKSPSLTPAIEAVNDDEENGSGCKENTGDDCGPASTTIRPAAVFENTATQRRQMQQTTKTITTLKTITETTIVKTTTTPTTKMVTTSASKALLLTTTAKRPLTTSTTAQATQIAKTATSTQRPTLVTMSATLSTSRTFSSTTTKSLQTASATKTTTPTYVQRTPAIVTLSTTFAVTTKAILEDVSSASVVPSKTTIIFSAAVALIIILIVVIFVVFKCRNKTSSTYTVDRDSKSYEQLSSEFGHSNGNGAIRPSQVISKQIADAKRKNVKEWYV